MKYFSLLFFCSVVFYTASGQQFINGDFENNTSTGCNYNLLNAAFNGLMSNVIAFGPNEEVDIQEGTCYETAPSGGAFISLAVQNDYSLVIDAVSIELTQPFISGYAYEISFYLTGNNDFGGSGDSIEIGISDIDTSFGQKVFADFPNLTAWEHITFSFIAPMTAQYLTVRNQGAAYGWTFVDDFEIEKSSSAGAINASQLSVSIFPNEQIVCTAPFNIDRAVLLNSNGQLMTDGSAEGNRVIFSVSGFSHGIYLLQFVTSSGMVLSKKVMI